MENVGKHRNANLVKIEKIKIWWKTQIVLYGWRKFHCIHKTNDIYKDIQENIETRFDTWNYVLCRPLPNGKNKKVIGLIKYILGAKIMTKFVGLRAKTYSYLIDDGREDN